MYAQQETISTLKEDDPDYNKKAVLAINRLRHKLGYFVDLIEKGEIKDPGVREYYRKQLVDTNEIAISIYANDKLSDYPGPQKIFDLIRNYHELTGKMEAYAKEIRQI